MRDYLKRIFSRSPAISIPTARLLSSPSQALNSLVSKDGHGIYASSDRLFKGAVFGRDSLEVAEDLLIIRPKLAAKIILTLASLQGEVFNNENEEEPGKIIHEYRRVVVDGKEVQGDSLKIFNKLSKRWGGNEHELAYYGSVDSTPLFLRVLGKYISTYGEEILASYVSLRSGRRQRLLSVAENALEWLENALANSKSGLLEYKRLNPDGIANQVWKDSDEFYIHEDGELANHNMPVASIEIQALVYDALLAASGLFDRKKARLIRKAESLRRKTIDELWLDDRNYFALGIDFSESGQKRIIKTTSANPASLLDSSFFDGAPDYIKYVSEIAREIMGTEFLTDVGTRSRGLSGAHLVQFWDYHGSFSSWPKETYDIAKGLRRWGMPKVALELENRLLNVVRAFKSYPEFFYVDARGRILGIPKRHKKHGYYALEIDSSNQPERIQAWTVSAIIAIRNSRRMRIKKKQQASQEDWQRELEAEILSAVPHVSLLRTQRELAARYPSYPYLLRRGK